jgi:anaphase-promoting complex subunit 10
LVQVRIVENHQNGKDTHVRGLKVYARDERVRGMLGDLAIGEEETERKSKVVVRAETNGLERGWVIEPDWMGEAELR